MVVIDCDSQEILSSIDTGDSPVHIYAIPSREEVWTHPDTNGTFDIVHMSDVSYLSHSHLEVHDEMPGHGKLLWDPNLQARKYSNYRQKLISILCMCTDNVIPVVEVQLIVVLLYSRWSLIRHPRAGRKNVP